MNEGQDLPCLFAFSGLLVGLKVTVNDWPDLYIDRISILERCDLVKQCLGQAPILLKATLL